MSGIVAKKSLRRLDRTLPEVQHRRREVLIRALHAEVQSGHDFVRDDVDRALWFFPVYARPVHYRTVRALEQFVAVGDEQQHRVDAATQGVLFRKSLFEVHRRPRSPALSGVGSNERHTWPLRHAAKGFFMASTVHVHFVAQVGCPALAEAAAGEVHLERLEERRQ